MNNFLLEEFQKKSKNRLSSVEAQEFLDLIDEGIVVLGNDLKINYVNRKALDLINVNKSLDNKIISFCNRLVVLSLKKKQSYKKIYKDEKSKIAIEISSIYRTSGAGIFLLFKDKTSDFKMVEMGKDFVANASHELKTPLTIIKGYSETLKEFSNLKENIAKEIIDKIYLTSIRLENIIFDLLTLADIENLTSISFLKSSLKSIFQNTSQLISQVNPKAKIKLNFPDEDIYILADSGLLEMALKNLLENSIKYSKTIPLIEVFFKLENKKVIILLKDNAMGIPEKDLPFIFNRFYRVDKARSRKMGGTGLGLSLVKNIFEKHGGTISVDSQVDKGSEFKIILPLF